MIRRETPQLAVSVAPGGTCELTTTYTVTEADVVAGEIENIGTADSDETGSVTDTEVVVVPDPVQDALVEIEMMVGEANTILTTDQRLEDLRGTNGLTAKTGGVLEHVTLAVEGCQAGELTHSEALAELGEARNLALAFINQVEAKIANGQIPDDLGDTLIGLAEDVLAQILVLEENLVCTTRNLRG